MTTEIKERLIKEPNTIGILGTIGSGKTTLSKILSAELGIERIEEKYAENPYLAEFYADMNENSFKSQLWFLTNTVDQLREVDRNKKAIFDPSNEMNYLYAKTHVDMGWMSQHEFNLYMQIYNILEGKSGITKPDLFICLTTRQDVLISRIQKRGRPYEMEMLDKYPVYLSRLNKNVSAFMGGNVIKVDTSNDNFTDSKNIEKLIQRIKEIK